MNKRALLIRFSDPWLAPARTGIAALRDQVYHSQAARFAQLWLRLRQGGSPPAVALPLSSHELAHLIPSLPALQHDQALISAYAQVMAEYGLSLFACLYWLDSIKLQLLMPLPLRAAAYRRWWEVHGPAHFREADRLLERAGTTCVVEGSFCDRPFGVNLVGHAFSLLGLGEYLRMMARALEAAAIPFCVCDSPIGSGASNQDRTLESMLMAPGQPLPFAFTLFCMTANSQLDLALKQRYLPSPSSYTISCWFWEMEHWPDPLRSTLELAHEFWPCTRLIETALQGAVQQPGQPVILIPPVVDLTPCLAASTFSSSRTCDRNHFGLDPGAVLFAFSFDLNSSIARKNPQAVLRAFQLAFGTASLLEADPRVGLVIKCFPPRDPEPLWEALKAIAASDLRITIIEANLDRAELLSLYGCCDAFVSLHRSEGLGLSPAEALQLGLDVIATDYGGNTDFCDGPLAHPVPFDLIPVQAGEYPYHEGLVWADPDVHEAARHMQLVATARRTHPLPDPSVVQAYRDRFSAPRIGALYRQRLEDLWDKRVQIQAHLDHR